MTAIRKSFSAFAHFNWMLLLGYLAGVGPLLSGCHALPPRALAATPLAAGDTVMVRTELYFGLSKKGGGEISREQFDGFIADIVTPRFPQGLTIVDGAGQWREPDGQIERENSKILILLHDPGDRAARAIEEIRSAYKSRFGEESVMRVTSTAGVSF